MPALHDVGRGHGSRRSGDQAGELGAQLIDRVDADAIVVRRLVAVGDQAGQIGADDRGQASGRDLAIELEHRDVVVPDDADQLEAVLGLDPCGHDQAAEADRDAGELDDRIVDLADLGPDRLADLVGQEVTDGLAGEAEDHVVTALGLQEQVLAEDALADHLVGDDRQGREVRVVPHVGLAHGLGIVRRGQDQRVGVGVTAQQSVLEQEAEGLEEPSDHGIEVVADAVVLEDRVVEDVGVEGSHPDLVIQITEETEPAHPDRHAVVVGGGLVDLVEDRVRDQALGVEDAALVALEDDGGHDGLLEHGAQADGRDGQLVLGAMQVALDVWERPGDHLEGAAIDHEGGAGQLGGHVLAVAVAAVVARGGVAGPGSVSHPGSFCPFWGQFKNDR